MTLVFLLTLNNIRLVKFYNHQYKSFDIIIEEAIKRGWKFYSFTENNATL
jgi:hypothetical protein